MGKRKRTMIKRLDIKNEIVKLMSRKGFEEKWTVTQHVHENETTTYNEYTLWADKDSREILSLVKDSDYEFYGLVLNMGIEHEIDKALDRLNFERELNVERDKTREESGLL